MITGIYQIFAEATTNLAWACGPGCATCCTRSVTLTTGEGRLISDFLRQSGYPLPELPIDPIPLRPALTANGLAGCYLAGQEPAEEPDAPWLFEPCFFLNAGLCRIYEVRPFACRSFASTVNCGLAGMAEVPEWLITLAIVTNQILEDLDQGGWWGNLADVLAFLEDGRGQAAKATTQGRLLPNLPAPGLLLVREEWVQVEKYLSRIGEVAGVDFGNLLSGSLR
ncbi:MAG: YkgJ family cysteine cluster protein [Desulfobulbaceae bacterium]|nr:YkgJ family cysteine cluster protein [Desulfobulbaceae bacterium]